MALRARRRAQAWLLAALGGAAAAASCRAPDAADPPRAPAAALAVGPLTFFEDRCARCHGPYGAMYVPGMSERLDRRTLARVVREMVEGPAQARLDPQDLAALTAFHLSLDDARPFLAVTRRDGARFAGEVTPGAFVRAAAGPRSIPAVVIGHDWGLVLPAEVDPDRIVLEAEREGARTLLDPDDLFSHRP